MHIYDIESYPNVFTLAIKEYQKPQKILFEISDRRNDWNELSAYINYLARCNEEMVGFNNVGYDYPVLHHVLQYGPACTAMVAFNKTSEIIGSENRFAHIIWERDRIVKQIDLFLIHHFDNVAKFTSLKMLEFNMRSEAIQELPYEPGTYLTPDQIDPLIEYNHKDVAETEAFLIESESEIKFRRSLPESHINFNNGKIGKQRFIDELEKATPGVCWTRGPGGRRIPRQTPRPQIAIADVIFPYVRFERPEFTALLEWFKRQVITETKGVFTKIPAERLGPLVNYCHTVTTRQTGHHAPVLNAVLDGFQYDFGTGGIHGSIEGNTVVSTATHQIMDVDITSDYPSIAIENRVYPKHLGETFCDVYQDIKTQRIGYPKGTPENKMLKEALNIPYGDSNNKYGPFYDPKYTMTITINGQLLLCMLAEQVIKIPGLRMIQINTDGLTVSCPRPYIEHFRSVCKWWEKTTHLDLEEAFYDTMWIRDVNNYIAQYPTGKLKRKGAYLDTPEWHKNHSSLIVQKAVGAVLIYGADLGQFIRAWPDVMDFMLRTKVPRSSRLVMVDAVGNDTQLQNITRYYVSNEGGALVKIMPPTKKKPLVLRRIGINVGLKVTECNDMRGATVSDINYDWYIAQASKLIEAVRPSSP